MWSVFEGRTSLTVVLVTSSVVSDFNYLVKTVFGIPAVMLPYPVLF